METYTTVQGDTWDMISFRAYGTSKYIGLLMENNYDLLDIFIFSSGTEVNIPSLPDDDSTELPEWRK